MHTESRRRPENVADRAERLSRFLALVLRHKPDSIGLALDPAGFVEIAALAQGMAGQPGWEWVTDHEIRAAAQRDPRRYEVEGDRIRARYGHTTLIETPGRPVRPPEWLYHGALPAAIQGIQDEGLKPQDRLFVHLSTTRQDAIAVGRRHGTEVQVITVLARAAAEAGIPFYEAGPTIYLVRAIPPEFLRSG